MKGIDPAQIQGETFKSNLFEFPTRAVENPTGRSGVAEEDHQ